MPTNVRYRITRVVTPTESMALVTLEQAKAALGIAPEDTSQDAALQLQIDAVSVAVNNYCGRIFAVQTYQDTLRYVAQWLYAGEPLRTRQYPIVVSEGEPLIAVIENGATVDVAFWDVYPEEGTLYRIDGGIVTAWSGTTIVVDYTAGFDPVPPDVAMATLEWLTARHGAIGRDPGLRSETIPDVITQVWGTSDTSAASSSIPAAARDLLAPYRVLAV